MPLINVRPGKSFFVLATLNAKFIHSSLSLRYLEASASPLIEDLVVKEYNINQTEEDVFTDLYSVNPYSVGFSCYIWNIERTLELASDLKKVLPNLFVFLGGPEVSFTPKEVLAANPAIDAVVVGEGELPLRHLAPIVCSWHREGGTTAELIPRLEAVPSLVYRKQDGSIASNAVADPLDPAEIPDPYAHLSRLEGKVAYFETSRGCPFRCEFCLSGISSGVRFLPLERVKSGLQRLAESGVEQVRFTDRTFNCNRRFARDIIDFIQSLPGRATYQMEIAADLIDDELLAYLLALPPGRFQFEIGVQSTNPVTLAEIRRQTDLGRLATVVDALARARNIRLHLDLIAGLPHEDMASFRRSFNYVHGLKPTTIQLGFLKLLKGSGLWRRAAELGYVFSDYPPYEVLQSDAMSQDDLTAIRVLKHLVDRYYNNGEFLLTLDYLVGVAVSTPYDLFSDFAAFWFNEGLFGRLLRPKEYYDVLRRFVLSSYPTVDPVIFEDILRFDYYSGGRRFDEFEWSAELAVTGELRHEVISILQKMVWSDDRLSHLSNLSRGEMARKASVALFRIDPLVLFAPDRGPGRLDRDRTAVYKESTVYLFDHDRTDYIHGRATPIRLRSEALTGLLARVPVHG